MTCGKIFYLSWGLFFNKIFFVVVKHCSTGAFKAIVNQYYLELKLMDMSIIFLYGDVKEKIYMEQSEGLLKDNYKVHILK